MTRLLALWKKEWLALWRDKHGLLALFVMPAVFILIMSLALQDAFAPTQIQRVMQRSKLDHASAASIVASQASRQQRWQIADAVIHNGAGTNRQQLHSQVRALASGFGLMIAPEEPPSDPVRIPLQ